MTNSTARPVSVAVALAFGWVLAVLALFNSVVFASAALTVLNTAATEVRFLAGTLSDAILILEYVVLLVMTHRRRNWARIVFAAFCIHIAITSSVLLWSTSQTSGTFVPPLYAAIRVLLGVVIALLLLREPARRYFAPSSSVA
jgi:hypothetical protein